MRRARTEPVAVTGILIGFFALSFGFVQVRKNRLANGVPHHLWQMGVTLELALYLALLLLALILELSWRREDRAASLAFSRGLIGNLLIVLIFVSCAVGAKAVQPTNEPYARISFAPGLWLAALAGYVLILSALKRLSGWQKLLVSLLGVAVIVVFALSGVFNDLSLAKEYLSRRDRFTSQLVAQIALSLGATGIAAAIGIPLGVWAFRSLPADRPIFVVVNTVQTIPSLALFGLLIAPLSILSHHVAFLRALGVGGIGWAPALIALSLYALLPIVRNTYTSLKVLDPSVIEAGQGMGMGRRQLLFEIEVPLSLPVILGGLRTSLVQAIGNTAVAALIGAGGFGVFIFQGLGQAAPDLILLGTIPVILLAVLTDRLMQLLIRVITPRGVRATAREAAA